MNRNNKIKDIRHTIRYSLAPLTHRYLINILFSLRVSGDLPSKAWQGRAGTRRVED